MNGRKLLVDTNIILYLLDGMEKARSMVIDKEIYISFITEIELLSFRNLSAAQSDLINALLNDCRIISFNDWIKHETIRIRKENKLKIPDSIILATSSFLNIPFLTGDKRLAKASGVAGLILFEEK